MNVYLTGNIVFDGDIRVSEDSKLVGVFEDSNKRPVYTEQIDCSINTLAIFKYMPFEIKTDLDLDGLSFRAEVRNGPVAYQSEPYKITSGIEQFDVQMRRVKQLA